MAFESLPSPRQHPPLRRWLERLEVIRVLQAHPAVADAAQALNISADGLIREIEHLESQLRVQLFRRVDGRLEATAAGQALWPVANQMLDQRDQLFAQLKLLEPGQKEVEIGACTTAGDYVLPVLLQTFRSRSPDVQVTMQVADSGSIVEGVRAGKYEFGIIGSAGNDADLYYEALTDDEIVVIAPPGHPLMSKTTLDVADLSSYPWIVREGGSATRSSLERMLAQQLLGQRVCVALILESTEAIKLAVRVGDGIAFVSRRAVQNELAVGQLKAMSLPGAGLIRELSLVRRKRQILAFSAVELWNHLLASAREHELCSVRQSAASGR